jgi:DHA1 family tetracycline resistance protein-like MFS transporter
MAAVLLTVALSAAGIGLVMPVLPALLRELGAASGAGWQYGTFLALYAALQAVFSPLLGELADRVGRRPVLLASLAGAAVDDLVMARAPTLGLLFVGRAIAGITGASMAVASSYVADVTPPEDRARRFGQLGAAFGVGFIVGPALGGVLGATSLRAPFVAAGVLHALTLALAALTVREPRRAPTPVAVRAAWSPLAPLRWLGGFPALWPMLSVHVVLALVGEIGGVAWVLYGQDRFGWDARTVGLSLTGFGLFHALAQAFVAGPMTERWGERRTLLVAIAADAAANLAMASTSRGEVAFLLIPLFCLGGVGAPVLQGLLASRVEERHQGRLQGVLASLTSLVSVAAPVAVSTIYFATRAARPGAVWLVGAALYVLCAPALLGRGAVGRVGGELLDAE